MTDDDIAMLYLLDEIDLRIVAVLQEDASIENQELARRVHLSPAPCLRRVRRLKEDGIIRQTVTLLDPARLWMTVEVYAFIALENQRTASGQQFETMLRRRPEVVECVRLSGAYDYLLKVVVESIEAYSVFIDKYVITLSAIRSVNSSFVLGVLKRTTALPLPGPRRIPHARRPKGSVTADVVRRRHPVLPLCQRTAPGNHPARVSTVRARTRNASSSRPR
jgi:Lrp/AsnC family transcriptional regulator, leucine-responsive regulatory protein